MVRAGTASLRRQLAKYLSRVKRGEHLIVTERGRPVAEIVPYAYRGGSDLLAARLADLARRGLLQPPSRPLGKARPPAVNRSQRLASAIIAEDRG